MGLYQDPSPSSFSSLQQLLKELENLIFFESGRNGNPWISVVRLKELFYEKYGASLDDVLQAEGISDSLRSLFASSGCFSIYATPIPQEFYIAPLEAVVPRHNLNQKRPILYRNKRPYRRDRNLPKMLKAKDVEITSQSSSGMPNHPSILVAKIKSVDDLEVLLIEIVKDLTINYSKQLVMVEALSKKFYDYYRQPVRTVMKSVCPDMRLIDLLQTIPSLHVKKMNNGQIMLKLHSEV